MDKDLKFKLKNIHLGKTAGLDKLKAKLAGEKEQKGKGEKEEESKEKKEPKKGASAPPPPPAVVEEKPRRIKAKTRSAFAPKDEEAAAEEVAEVPVQEEVTPQPVEEEEIPLPPVVIEEEPPAPIVEQEVAPPPAPPTPSPALTTPPPLAPPPPKIKLGPTGRHISDLLPAKKEKPKEAPPPPRKEEAPKSSETPAAISPAGKEEEESPVKKKVREFRDFRPKAKDVKHFDSRDRQGLSEEDERWRKKRGGKQQRHVEEQVTRPTSLKIRLPISIKDLAVEMKLKSSELIQKLFLQGIALTLNDLLDDPTVVQYLGSEFHCQIQVDTTEEERIQITSQSIEEEISSTPLEKLQMRHPVITFMGHVDHGKTSLIDAIRKSNLVAGEAGAITQHIGAFRCKTDVGDITVLDTPGHEAFSEMRARGAKVTDIVVLVVAGDEGIREQTTEAIKLAKTAGVTIVVALNKCDKPNFNAENIYRQLSEIELLPETWGGQTITVNTSAVTGQGIPELLEMLALQSEVLNLKANVGARARGTVIESQLHKGHGVVATVLIQNGTLRQGDAVVIDHLFGRIKTMRDEFGHVLTEAGPSTPVEITGLSGVPKAGDAFVVVKSEKEARDIAEERTSGFKQKALQQKKATSLETLFQKESAPPKKVLRVVLRADVQGSLEALKVSLQKIDSQKVVVDIISLGVGEITESDAELAQASNAVILGFHTQIESHASALLKEKGVIVRLHDIIYHAIDDVKGLMLAQLDKIVEERECGRALVQAIFKASQLGVIAGCIVTDGIILRTSKVRVERDGKEIWKGSIASLKRVKEDVREVKKGVECGIFLERYNDIKVDDKIVAYEILYHTQEL